MKLNLTNIARDVRFGIHEIEILRANIPSFPFDKIGLEEYPLSFFFNDLHGNKHDLELTEDGKLFENGTLFELQDIYPLLYGIDTEEGKSAALEFEGAYIRPMNLNHEYILDTSRYDSINDWFEKPFKTQKLKIEEVPGKGLLKIHCLSSSGYVLATKEFHLQNRQKGWNSNGVFRLSNIVLTNSNPTVLVVRDPITAEYFNDQQIPAISLPSADEITHYNYSKLFESSTIYFIVNIFSESFEHSIYPLAQHLMAHGIKVNVVNTLNAFYRTPLAKWFSTHGKEHFEKAIVENSTPLRASDVPSKTTYNQISASKSIEEITPAQHFQNNTFLFKVSNSEDFVVSPPIRITKGTKLKKYEGFTPDHSEKIESVVTSDSINKIQLGQYLNPSLLFDFTERFLKHFLYFPNYQTYSLITCWILGTYFYRAFDAYPYLHIRGKHGSGKTSLLEVIQKLSFNGRLLTKATISAMTEAVHLTNATLCLDEFEDFSRNSNAHDELSRFLNGGYNYRGSYTKKYRKFSKTYSTYSPKVFGGTGAVNLDTLRSRMIPIQMHLKPENKQITQFVEFEPETLLDINKIQSSALAIPLLFSTQLIEMKKKISTNIQLPISGNQLNNRELQLARPILTVAKLADHFSGKEDAVTQRVLEELDRSWNTDTSAFNEFENALKTQFEMWNDDPEFIQFTHQGKYCWIPNNLWESTILMEYFNSKNEILKWFNHLNGVKKGSVHFPHEGGSLSATKFPWNLKLCGEEFRSFFKK